MVFDLTFVVYQKILSGDLYELGCLPPAIALLAAARRAAFRAFVQVVSSICGNTWS